MKKILVVEDETAIREFVVINLKRAGYDVVEADSGEAAVSYTHLSTRFAAISCRSRAKKRLPPLWRTIWR